MKLKLLGFFPALLLMFASCSDNDSPGVGGYGQVNASVSADNAVSLSTEMSRAGEQAPEALSPDLNSFSLTISRKDGSFSKTWETLDAFDPTQQFPIGAYNVEASYGALEKEGFDMPYYYGTEECIVYDSETSTPTVVATLANTMVSVNYTEEFKKYFTDYSVSIKSEGGSDFITFAKDEVRNAYVRPGNISLNVSLTKTNGKTLTFNPADIANAKPKTLYRVTFDVNGGEVGTAQLVIKFDSQTVLDPITITLSDDLVSSPAPEIKAKGFESGVVMEMVEGDTPVAEVSAMLTAMAGLQEVTLTTVSEDLIAAGWPAQVDLMAATESQKTLMKSKGLKVFGLWSNPDKMAKVDFTGLLENLHPKNGSFAHKFTLQVKDKYTKLSETVELSVNAPAVQLELSEPGLLFIGQTSQTVNVLYNGKDIQNKVKIKALNDFGTWENCEITKVEDLGNSNYKLTFNIPVSTEPLKIKAVYQDAKESAVIETPRSNPSYSIAVAATDAWATKAYVTVNPEDVSITQSLVNMAYVYVKAEDGSYVLAQDVVKDAQNGRIEIAGLQSAKAYTVKITLSAIPTESDYSNEVSFTTEAAAALPNGGFEDLVQTINISKINQGGKWSNNTHWGKIYNTTSYLVKEPTGWATVNAKTCAYSAAKNKNTWFVIPSTMQTSKVHGGSNAMMLRNVSWDLNGSEPGASTNWGEDYCVNTPGTIANTSAGKLFLGRYTFDSASMGENYTEGLEFTSRPTSLVGYYKYKQDSQDNAETGIAEVEVLSGETVIGTGKAQLSSADAYTQFTAKITYTNTSLKATKVKVMIASSNHASETQSTETSSIKTTKRTEKEQNAYGAVLFVDDLSFVY